MPCRAAGKSILSDWHAVGGDRLVPFGSVVDGVATRNGARSCLLVSFFFNGTATTDIYTLSLHDALPILVSWIKHSVDRFVIVSIFIPKLRLILILNSFLGSSDSLVFSELFRIRMSRNFGKKMLTRSEERFSRNAETDLVCRLLLEKKKD